MHIFFHLLKLIQNRGISAGAWMNVVNPDLYYFFSFQYIFIFIVCRGSWWYVYTFSPADRLYDLGKGTVIVM